MTLVAKVLTVSDSVHEGRRVDEAGPALRTRLEEAGYDVAEVRVVADGVDSVANALYEMSFAFVGLIVTSGGTGFSPRDQTPEATLRVLEREAPGLGEAMRAVNPLGSLSRGRAGTRGQCLVVNTPGSPRAALESLDALVAILPHALALLAGEDEAHPGAR